jgi:hypothetical protein
VQHLTVAGTDATANLPSGFCNKHLIASQRQRAGDSQSNHPSSNYQNVTRHLNLFKSSGS